ncbi:MAG: site-specific tyrosine recombinase XerD [Paracoccaceae bacterium]|nr:site-specific tyrosine recombinase XerD [Paracoccaceae bacterium]
MDKISKLIDYFLHAQFAEFKSSENTIFAYRRDLYEFNSQMTKIGKSLTEVEKTDIESFIINLSNKGLAASTRARKISSIKSFYKFLFEEKLRNDNPTLQIKQPKLTNKLPRTLSESDVEKMLKVAKNFGKSDSDKIRNQCLLELLYATGMRVTELLSLPVSVANHNSKMLYITGKGGKERLVPLSTDAQNCLRKWLSEWDKIAKLQKKTNGEDIIYLFPSKKKTGHLTRIWFYKLIKEIALKASLNPMMVSPHTLRHAFATHLLANGADLRVIQTFLGHSDISSTEIYTHVLTHRLKDLVEKHHPLANSKKIV